MQSTVYFSLGSNLGDRYLNLSKCISLIEKNKNENCELITKKMTIENRGEFPQGCNDECLLIALGVATTSYIVSGSIAVVGHTVHWIEKQGRCEDSYIRD